MSASSFRPVGTTDGPADPAPARGAPHRRWAAVLCGLFMLLTVLVVGGWHPLLAVDSEVARGLHGLAVDHPGWTEAGRVLTDWVWDPVTMRVVAMASAVWLWRRGAGRAALWLLGCTAAAAVVQQGVKAAVGRDRPRWPDPVDSAHYAAFPSGHAMTAAVVCGALVWLHHLYASRRGRWGPWVRGAASVSVLGAGLTRLYLGVHWLTDVLAGWLLGLALVLAAAGFLAPARGAPPERPAVRRGWGPDRS
ncbi:phosphatase PAP2 family protein [Streptomyces sp. NPDC059637]|uniref:phosphatase PAP2 family protein n=1 Tax=Streptomyces sp. NPDC059637 TaxID=3347752 RepID=UPI0036A7BDF8